MRTASRAVALLLLVALVPATRAAVPPDELIRTAVTGVIAAYEAGKARLDSDPGFLRGVVERHILPHVDVELMSRLILGDHWRRASASQRAAFTDAFHEHLVLTYSAPLAEYRGQRIEFLPYTAGDDPERAFVSTEIVPHTGPPIPVVYRLRVGEDGSWKVYDLSIDGVSMVTNYHSAYSLEIARDGLERFIDGMAERARESRAATDQ